MRFVPLLLLLAAPALTGCNIGICDTDVTVTNQDELNAMRECPRIEGSLTIGPSDLEAIDSMAGVSGIVGDLRVIQNTTLKDLDGLIEIVEVGGDILVEENDALLDISGVHQLSLLSGDVTIRDNAALHHLAGIIRVTEIVGSLTIERNDSLDDLQGLRALVDVGGALTISENAALESLDGAEDLTRAGALTIRDNPLLPACAAENLASRVELDSGEPDLAGNDGTGGCS